MPLKTINSISKNIFSGGTPSTSNESYWNGHYPWLSSGETSERYIETTLKTITREGIDNSSTRLAKKNTIVIASAGQGHTRGQTSMLLLDTYINQSIIAIEADSEQVNPYFLFYNLSNRYDELRTLSDGTSSRGSLTTKIIGEMTIDLPPIKKQDAIVHIIKTIDKKILCNNRINDNLMAIANQFFDHYFPYTIDDDLPDGWNKGKLGEIIQIHDSKRIPLSAKQRSERSKIYPYYGAASITDYVDNYLFDGVYLLLGEDGTVVTDAGKPVLQYVFGKFWVNNHAHILTGDNGYSVESLYLLCQRLNVASIITGAVQPKISQSNLKDISIVIPPVELITQFSDSISRLFDQYRNNILENAKLTTIRDCLLPKLMSGEIDVSDLLLPS